MAARGAGATGEPAGRRLSYEGERLSSIYSRRYLPLADLLTAEV